MIVRTAAVMAACHGCVQAALEVDFVTNRGTVTVVMEYTKAPLAVANVVGLAKGRRAWVNPQTGRPAIGPFYNGLAFYQVSNNASAKTAEVGSLGGTIAGEPGYTFPDEFHATLTHAPYVLSMVNDGPNTNGSRLCFTGNLTMSSRDGRYTVLGGIPGAASRTVVNSILTAGANATTIQNVVVRATDAAARAFDELSVPLPVVGISPPAIRVTAGAGVEWLGVQPAGSVLQAYASDDLSGWQPHFRHMTGLDDALTTNPIIDDGLASKRFYAISLVTFPNARGVSGFASRTLTVDAPGTGLLIYHFNATGDGGTYENVLFPGDPPWYAGAFQVRHDVPLRLDPYGFQVLLHANGLGGAPMNLIRGGWDQVQSAKVTGRHLISMMTESMAPVFDDSGTMEITR